MNNALRRRALRSGLRGPGRPSRLTRRRSIAPLGDHRPRLRRRTVRFIRAARPISAVHLRRGLLAAGHDIGSAGALVDVLDLLDLVPVIAVAGHQDPTALDLALVALGLELWHSHTHERADDQADAPAHTRAAEQAHDRPGRDERSDTRDRQGPDAREGPQRPADHAARQPAPGRAL